MDWAMKDMDFKIRLLQFIDVSATLRNDVNFHVGLRVEGDLPHS
jgi:hypothetical protein